MNDFSDLEEQLKSMRPVGLRENFVLRLEQALADPAEEAPPEDKIVRPDRFRFDWALGIGLAVAATLLVLVRVNFQPPENKHGIASISPGPVVRTPVPKAAVPDAFVPTGATQIVYHTRDEGLLFPASRQEPMRRVVSITKETWQWHNPTTGASLRVSYPSERVDLIPVSAQ